LTEVGWLSMGVGGGVGALARLVELGGSGFGGDVGRGRCVFGWLRWVWVVVVGVRLKLAVDGVGGAVAWVP
jgi:hypothetical protein